MTHTINTAWAVATDIANRRMKKHGRTKWSRGDYNLAKRILTKLLPDPE